MHHDETVTQVTPFSPDSELYFPVVERKVAWISKNATHGGAVEIDTHKALIRVLDTNEPHHLAIVGANYKKLMNGELYPFIEERIQELFTPEQLVGLIVNEQMAHQGRDCYKEYIFKAIKCDIGEGGDIYFRLIIGNSYGSKAVTLMYGAIDWWCANGQVIGTHEKSARKHTSGLTMSGLDTWITDSVSHFMSHGAKMWQWNHNWMTVEQLEELLQYLVNKHTISKTMAATMVEAIIKERDDRANGQLGVNLFHLNSAFTQWATHGEVRNTGNDHEANTRLERTKLVTRVMQAACDWYEWNVQEDVGAV